MTIAQRFILGFAHCVGSGALGFGAFVAKLRGNWFTALLFAGGCLGMLMFGLLWMDGTLDDERSDDNEQG